jgi:signal transduction histidine kinase
MDLSPRNETSDMEEFAYLASHDLKAALRAIDNLAQWIGEDLGKQASPEFAENLILLHERVRRANHLLDGLLAYARAGHVVEAFLKVDLNQLTTEAISASISRPGIRVELEGELPSFIAPPKALGQVLAELISNAVKHHDKSNGLVSIRAKDSGTAMEITVSDDGPGIDPNQQQRIFKLGLTLRSKEESGGSGIGLAIVEKITRQYGASLTLVSALGQGCSFHLNWPKTI